jgi:hypothetical protein
MSGRIVPGALAHGQPQGGQSDARGGQASDWPGDLRRARPPSAPAPSPPRPRAPGRATCPPPSRGESRSRASASEARAYGTPDTADSIFDLAISSVVSASSIYWRLTSTKSRERYEAAVLTLGAQLVGVLVGLLRLRLAERGLGPLHRALELRRVQAQQHLPGGPIIGRADVVTAAALHGFGDRAGILRGQGTDRAPTS